MFWVVTDYVLKATVFYGEGLFVVELKYSELLTANSQSLTNWSAIITRGYRIKILVLPVHNMAHRPHSCRLHSFGRGSTVHLGVTSAERKPFLWENDFPGEYTTEPENGQNFQLNKSNRKLFGTLRKWVDILGSVILPLILQLNW